MPRRWLLMAGICLTVVGFSTAGCLSLMNLGANIACAQDDGCPSGFVCEEAEGLCVANTEGEPCTPYSQDCNSHERCIDDVCVFAPECTEDADCYVGNECLEYVCTPIFPCDDHRDCSSTEACALGACITRECGDDSDCEPDQHCWSGGQCFSDARETCDHFECAALPEAPLCVIDDAGQWCNVVECISDYVCGAGFVCYEFNCTAGFWTDPMPDGYHCSDASDCQESGYCHHFDASPTNTFCSRDCDAGEPYAGCIGASFCHPDGHCAPNGPNNMGRDCSEDLDCRYGVCLTSGDSAYCSKFCTSDSGCPIGWTCIDLDDFDQNTCQRP